MTLTFVNNAYCRYFERRSEDLLGKSFLSFIPEAERPAAAARRPRVDVEKWREIVIAAIDVSTPSHSCS
jgi:PAS domain-containing protein